MKTKTRYFEIISGYINQVIGICIDIQDVLKEENCVTFAEINKKQFDKFNDGEEWAISIGKPVEVKLVTKLVITKL